MALKKIKLGTFAAGEIPNPISHQFTTHEGVAIDMTGWTILGFYVEGDGETAGVVAWDDITVGRLTYTWDPDDTQTAGPYQGLLWVQNMAADPTRRFASDLFVWDVADGPGPTPPA
jgi:hypothetical protein